MKNRFWIVALLLVLGVLIARFWKKPQHSQVSQPVSRETPAINLTPSTAAPIIQNRAPVISEVVTSSTGQTITMLSNTLHNPKVYQRDIESHNVPIYFYGRVVNQSSNALENVSVRVSIRHWTVPNPNAFDIGSTEINAEASSDADGRFEIHEGTGDGVYLESVQKDGYELEPVQRNFGPANGSYANPVAFKMWSTNVHEQLIGGKKVFEIVPDSRRYVIDLVLGTISESGDGDLNVWVSYTNQIVRGQIYDWSAGIDVINGGLLEKGLGSAMYEAPADGYVPSFKLQQQIKGGQSGEIGERQFYLQLKNGQEYGQMTIDLYAPYNNQIPGLVRVSYAVNPSGSRILH